MKQVILILVLASFLLNGCSQNGLSNTRNIHSALGENIVCFGDSITAGVGAGEGEDYPSLLRSKLKITVINSGHGGDTTFDALQKVDAELKYHPKIIIVEFGANDFMRALEKSIGKAGQSHIQAFKNLEIVVKKLQDAGAVVVIAGINLNDYYSAGYRKLAKKTHSVLIPDIMEGIRDDQNYMSADNIHPNAAGYRKMADIILNVIEPLLTEMGK